MNAATPDATQEATVMATSGLPRNNGRSHWIVLDAAWARRLEVRRDAGVYRIRSTELIRKLGLLRQQEASRITRPIGADLAA